MFLVDAIRRLFRRRHGYRRLTLEGLEALLKAPDGLSTALPDAHHPVSQRHLVVDIKGAVEQGMASASPASRALSAAYARDQEDPS